MRLARPLAKLRYALLIPLALAALVSTPTFAQTEVIVSRRFPWGAPAMCGTAGIGVIKDVAMCGCRAIGSRSCATPAGNPATGNHAAPTGTGSKGTGSADRPVNLTLSHRTETCPIERH
jgi:hypothetical protein